MSSSRSIRAIEEQYPIFCDRIRARLQTGAKEYGDASFSRDPLDLIDEIQQELLDVSGWGFILWLRLEGLRERLSGAATDREKQRTL